MTSNSLPPTAANPSVDKPIAAEAKFKPFQTKKLSLIIALMAAGGLSALAFYAYQHSPANILRHMRAQLSSIHTGKFQAQLEFSFPPSLLSPNFSLTAENNPTQTPGLLTIALRLDGSFDAQDKNPPNTEVILSSKISGASANPFDFGGVFRAVNGKFYFKPQQLPTVAEFDLSPLAGIWLNFDKPTNRQPLESSSKTSPDDANADLSSDLQQLKQFYADISRLIYQNLAVSKNYGRETIAGRPVYHYQVALKQEKFLTALNEYANTSETSWIKSYAGLLAANPQNFNTLTAELWIGQKNFLPYRITFDIPMGLTKGHTALTVEFTDFNQPVNISEPTNTNNFQDEIQKIFQQAQTTP